MPVIIQLNSLLFLLLHSFVSFLLSFLFLFLFPNTTSFFTYVVFAACAVVATALAQIFTNTYQKSLDCNAMQLLYHTSPIIALVRKEHSRNNILGRTFLELPYLSYILMHILERSFFCVLTSKEFPSILFCFFFFLFFCTILMFLSCILNVIYLCLHLLS